MTLKPRPCYRTGEVRSVHSLPHVDHAHTGLCVLLTAFSEGRSGSSLSLTVWSDKVTAAQEKLSCDRQASLWHGGSLQAMPLDDYLLSVNNSCASPSELEPVFPTSCQPRALMYCAVLREGPD